MKRPVIIDTDFGGDPDDILALLYAIKSPELEIAAVITNDEFRTNHRSMALKAWLSSMGIRVPVFTGADLGNENFFLLEDFCAGQTPAPPFLEGDDFAAVLRRVSDGRGAFMSIGGLANFPAMLDRFKPELMKLDIRILAGTITRLTERGEHNAKLDKQATRAVMQSGLNAKWLLVDHTFVPELQISKKHPLYAKITGTRAPGYDMVKANLDAFYDLRYAESYLHDPFAVAGLLEDSVTYGSRRLVLDDNGVFVSSESGYPVLVSASAQYDGFLRDFTGKIAP